MPCTMTQAHDQVLALVAAALPGLAVKYPDVAAPAGFPPQTASWARVSISDTDQGRPPPLVGEPQNRRYTTDGILTVELYALAGNGRAAAQALAETVLGAFRGQSTAGGVTFRRERPNDVGPDGPWYHINVIVEYRYDTLGN